MFVSVREVVSPGRCTLDNGRPLWKTSVKSDFFIVADSVKCMSLLYKWIGGLQRKHSNFGFGAFLSIHFLTKCRPLLVLQTVFNIWKEKLLHWQHFNEDSSLN